MEDARTIGVGGCSRASRSLPYIYGAIHAVVDASSAMVVFATMMLHEIDLLQAFYFVIIYDLLAFGTQVFFGAATDKLQRPKAVTMAGLGLLSCGTIMMPFEAYSAMILVGLGNAAFHVGAGAISLRIEPEKASHPGIFVAPGAIGLAFGIWLGKSGGALAWPFTLALAACFVVTIFLPSPEHPYVMRRSSEELETGDTPSEKKVPYGWLIILLLLFSVLVRSLVGMAGCYRCPKEAFVMFSLATAAVLGKGLGGIVSDRLGWIETSVVALLVSAPLIAFGGGTWWVIIVGMLLFQMTMPVTLTAIALVLPKRPGFAFGLACLALIIGAIMTFYPQVRAYYSQYAFLGLIVLSATTVYFGLRLLGDLNPAKGFMSRSQGRAT